MGVRRAGAAVLLAGCTALIAGGCGDSLAQTMGNRPKDRPSPSASAKPVPLEFRPVLASKPGKCPSDAPGSDFDDAGSAANGSETCLSVDLAQGMRVRAVKSARPKLSQHTSGGWLVAIVLNRADGERFAELSGEAAQQQDPRNRIAMIQRGRLLSAPAVTQSIPGGKLEISGSFTRASAEALAARLTGRQPGGTRSG
jgi:hypothetical protein